MNQPPQPPYDPLRKPPAPPQEPDGAAQAPAPGQPPVPGPPSEAVQPSAPGQPPIPGQAPGPYQPPGPHQPPFGQPPMPSGWGGQPVGPGMPYPAMRPPRSGSPVGAFFLGLLASFVIAALYTGINAAVVLDQTRTMVNTIYIAHGLINGAVVGWLVGMVGRRRTGAHIGGAVVATLGAFFGFTNSVPFMVAKHSGGLHVIWDYVRFDPLFPLQIWWGTDGIGHFWSLLGLVVAGATAWGVAAVVGRRRP